MCGITGWFGWELPEAERMARLRAMCDAIRHRGPDDCGFFFSDGIALGMQRLSILDIDSGHQPMTTSDGKVSIVFNGEIYNHQDIRIALQAQGIQFSTRSDTEVILKTYQTHGLAGFNELNGMFAVAIWDAEQRNLHLVRDRLGVKPLYYAWDGSRLFFGSEIKSILASGEIPRRMNPRALWDYLTFRYVPGPYSIWKNIYKLPPAHRLRLAPGMKMPEITRWWDIPYCHPSRQESDAVFDEEFNDLLDKSVRLRMLADVPVGILLSGGLDSSTVAALAMRHATAPIKTFSVAFSGAEHIDERPFAGRVAKHLGTDHHEVVIGQQEFCDSLSELVYHTDEPLADLASIPLLHVCRLAQSQVKVVLSGEGSDEILGGYDLEVYVQRWQEERIPHGPGGFLLNLLWPKSELDFRRQPTPFTMTNYLSSRAKQAMLRDSGSFPDSLDSLRDALERLGKQSPLHQTLYTFCQHWLVEDLLMKADRMSMACSLELRTPFLDFRLVEWAARVPASLKVGQDEDGSWANKRLLRRLAAGLLPDEILHRPKMGFPVPVYDWLKNSLRSFAHDLLSGPGCRIRQWFHSQTIETALSKGTAPEAELLDRHRLWNLLVLEQWARRWNA